MVNSSCSRYKRVGPTSFWPSSLSDPIILIYDNARSHINARVPPEFNNITIKRLPPYSPFFNPVEMAHSAFKAGVKQTLALPVWQARIGDQGAAIRAAGINMQGWRARGSRGKR